MPNGLNYNHLHYFHEVARNGSLAAAARSMNVAQSTVSEQVKQLEASLGGALFDRSRGGGLRLNDQGRRVFEHTSVMFRASARLIEELRGTETAAEHVLEVGVVSAVSKAFAAHFFMPLFDLEDVSPRVRTADNETLLRQLTSMEVDLLLTDSPPQEPDKLGLKCSKVHAPRLIAVASGELATGTGEFPEILHDQPLVHHIPNSRTRFEVDVYLRDNGIEPRIIGEVDDPELMMSMAEAGRAIALVPRSVASSRLESGSLVELGEVDALTITTFAVYHHRSTPRRVLDAVERLTRPFSAAPASSNGSNGSNGHH